MRTLSNRHHQQGAVIVTVALGMLFLLGLIGIAMDQGGIFAVKSDLQAEMNNCALAAAKELNGQSTALTRAASAGQAAGNTSTKITFKDASYMATTVPANAKYAQCQHMQSEIEIWLRHSMKSFSGNTVNYQNNQNIMALAVAARIDFQTTCPAPAALKPCTNSSPAGSVIGAPSSTLVH